jgi:hypothetical protein
MKAFKNCASSLHISTLTSCTLIILYNITGSKPGSRLDHRAIEVRSQAEARGFFLWPLCPDRLWGPPSLLLWVPGVLSTGIKRGLGVTLTTHTHLVPRSKISRSYTYSPPIAFAACIGTALAVTSQGFKKMFVCQTLTAEYIQGNRYCGFLTSRILECEVFLALKFTEATDCSSQVCLTTITLFCSDLYLIFWSRTRLLAEARVLRGGGRFGLEIAVNIQTSGS